VIVFELTQRQRLAMAAVIAAGPSTGMVLAAVLVRDLGRLAEALAAAVPVWLLATVVGTVVQRLNRVEVRPDGLAVFKIVGRRYWTWSEATSMTVRSGRLGRSVVVTGPRGTTVLPAPIDGPLVRDRDFDAKVAALHDHWTWSTASL
jgi:hypothetical protein